MMNTFLTRVSFPILCLLILLTLTNSAPTAAEQQATYNAYLPTISKPAEPLVEFRGLWVSRFDWTSFSGADPAKIDEIVDNASTAGFNAIFFQVRGKRTRSTPPA